jgi:biotin carboxyl carrier protein
MMIERMGLNVAASKKLPYLEAPMPGLVSVIKVSKGDQVEKGTPLLVLEAMKMENVITAPQEAVVKSILVKVGQAVEKGLKLIEFE